MQYLSDEWIEALDIAARDHPGLRAAACRGDLVIQQTVTDVPSEPGGPAGEVTYRIELRSGEARVVHGRCLDPTITLSTNHSTAGGIARGELAAQLAFMEGSLRIGGDVRSLLTHQEAMADLDDVFADVRARTEW